MQEYYRKGCLETRQVNMQSDHDNSQCNEKFCKNMLEFHKVNVILLIFISQVDKVYNVHAHDAGMPYEM